MKKNNFLKTISTLILSFSLIVTPISSFGHSGRTDGSGGHKDNGNKSGLGYYHYHHGYGPHLHTNGCPYAAKTVSNSYDQVKANKAIQTKLNELGYECGKADGKIGKNTKNAIKKFQKDNSLKADGIPGTNTKKALGL
ncbi:MAG: peptidoglycan-binding domain-containing protein [Acidaminobacteraceae bacterium]